MPLPPELVPSVVHLGKGKREGSPPPLCKFPIDPHQNIFLVTLLPGSQLRDFGSPHLRVCPQMFPILDSPLFPRACGNVFHTLYNICSSAVQSLGEIFSGKLVVAV